MRLYSVVMMLLMASATYAQEQLSRPDTQEDSLTQIERMKSQRSRSENALRQLKAGGGIVVRLKTNDKSVEAYRQAGRNDIADRMVQERKVMNQKIYDGFSRLVTFCPVYFIYAKDSRDLVAGKKGLLLNANLEYDDKIVMKDTFFVFIQQGSAQTNAIAQDNSHPPLMGSSDDKKFMGTDRVDGYSTVSASESAIIFIDKAFVQYYDPFPFSEGVYLENYNVAANAINKQLFRAYNKLVTMPDMRKELKKAKKESQKQMR
ncbi:MAG: hypothetical protein JST49_08335 [Bacteroidetes bacterium]|nr:hypothetical protein [Bacteroidota bacterium]